jgi:cysteine desulfurase / selenocysteine lyase
MSIYFDNAATSWPKPKSVIRAMRSYFSKCGGNPGRSGHRKAIEAGRIVLNTREKLAELLSVDDPSRIIFTKNATEGLNIVLFGVLAAGKNSGGPEKNHLLTTSMEHNSVLRPCRELTKRGVSIDIVEADSRGLVSPADIINRIGPETALVCVNHASNVTGTIQDIAAIAEGCGEKGVPLLVDAAQTAGALEINCSALGVDFLAASGHKGLLGPQGTGFLYVKEGSPAPLMFGGTGSLSDREVQPDFFPDCLESGTLNVIGIAGLGAGVEYIHKRGTADIRRHEVELLTMFLAGLREMAGVTVYGPKDPAVRTGVVSISIEGLDSSAAGEALDSRFGIFTRIGLHCAPRAHAAIGTFPGGTVRFGIGPFTKKREITAAVRAVRTIAAEFSGEGS